MTAAARSNELKYGRYPLLFEDVAARTVIKKNKKKVAEHARREESVCRKLYQAIQLLPQEQSFLSIFGTASPFTISNSLHFDRGRMLRPQVAEIAGNKSHEKVRRLRRGK